MSRRQSPPSGPPGQGGRGHRRVLRRSFASNLHTPIWALLTILRESIGAPLARAMNMDPELLAGLGSFSTFQTAHFSFTNTDFPVYTLFIGGVHPHNLSPPFTLLMVGVLLAYFTTPVDETTLRFILLAITTPLVGLIAIINTWSVPMTCGLIALTIALAPAHPLTLITHTERLHRLGPFEDWLSRLFGGILIGLLAAGLGTLWVLPYFLRGLAGDPSIGVLPPQSSPWFIVYGYGGFLLVFGGYLWLRLRDRVWRCHSRVLGFVLAGGLVVAGVLADFPGLYLLAPVLIVAVYLNHSDRSNFTTVLIIAGAGLALLIELAYVQESAEFGRINTVYKVYMQIWVLWGPAAGVALVAMLGARISEWSVPKWRPAVVSLVVLMLSIYAIAGIGGYTTIAAEHDLVYSLDGLAYLDGVYPDYGVAIDWLATHPGQPTIASAPVSEYRLYSINATPAASLTGIPTIVGWNHEADYRGETAYRTRLKAVDQIYAGTQVEQARALRTYNVTYIWVGEGEHYRYHTIDYSREPGISTAFQHGNITIYRVAAERLVPG